MGFDGLFMYIKTTGLVLRETIYKESSKLLNILTPDMGRITVSAKGARRRGSKIAAAAQFLTYSEIVLAEGKAGYTLAEGRSIEMFEGLREDLTLLSLGSYIAEVLETLSDEDCHDKELLTLGLNSLYALGNSICSPQIIKPVFETRVMCISGFLPMLDMCSSCGREDMDSACMSLSGGTIQCLECRTADHDTMLCRGALAAMRYASNADSKKIFSFSLSDSAAKSFGAAAEAYLLTQLDRGFKTLDFYKSIV